MGSDPGRRSCQSSGVYPDLPDINLNKKSGGRRGGGWAGAWMHSAGAAPASLQNLDFEVARSAAV